MRGALLHYSALLTFITHSFFFFGSHILIFILEDLRSHGMVRGVCGLSSLAPGPACDSVLGFALLLSLMVLGWIGLLANQGTKFNWLGQ